jgi:hypothetical protein
MSDKIDNAYTEYQFDKMIDPATRYTNDGRDVFRAGWAAGQRKDTPRVKESVWIAAPVAEDDDPE